MNEGTAEEKQKVKKSEYDEAFGALATFLFEQYKKKKQAELTQETEE